MKETDLPFCREMIRKSSFFRDYGVDPDKVINHLRLAFGQLGVELHVVEMDSVLVGFSWVVEKGGFDRSPYLRLLVVDDSYHRRGVGRALMTDMAHRHRLRGNLMLLVTETNHKARRFYESLGYTKIGLIEDYVKVGVHECIYRKRLCR